MEIIKKFYSKEDSTFHVVCRRKKGVFDEEKVFTDFKDFAKYLKRDLSKANLYDFSFENIDLAKYNINGALIKKEILEKQNLYDESFYNKHVLSYKDLYDENNRLSPVNVSNVNFNIQNIQQPILSKDVWYISDLHLNHKIYKRFPKGATKEEVKEYIHAIVDDMIGNDNVYFLLVAGDVSFDFEISRMFYEYLSSKFIGKIFAVLGNHELWDSKYNGMNTDDYDTIINNYQKLFDQCNINFINNSLYCYKYQHEKTYSQDELNNMSIEEIIKLCNNSYLTVFGGVGFSFYNNESNATSGIYRNTVKTAEQDKLHTLKFENLYKKMSTALSDYQIICLTHMPKEDWSQHDYNSNWIYVNGHTHKNFWKIDADATIYANNQIGYVNNNISLKSFPVNFKFEYFKSYSDGICEITALEYKMFYAGLQNWIEVNRKNGTYYMVKKNNNYCFFWKNQKNKLYLLEGGLIRTIENQDLEYYYNSIEKYTTTIKALIHDYNLKLKEISKFVKSFGGSGKIHGCIVDIDFYSHIYLNPYDNTITPYYAFDIFDKYVYNSVESLLYNNNKELYLKFQETLALDSVENSIKNVNKPRLETSIDIYKISRVIYALQRTSNFNVIRLWNDKIINGENASNEELLQLMLNN